MRFTLAAPGPVTLDVFDVSGRRVRTVLAGELAAGAHVAAWDGAGASGQTAAPGVYFARLATGGGTRTIRLVRAR